MPGGGSESAILKQAQIKPLKADAGSRPAAFPAGSRMSWRVGLLFAIPFFIALGWAPGHWPIAGETAVISFGLFYLAVFSLYYIVRSLVSPNSAFWSALFLGLNPWFLSSLGSAGGTGMACALGALALTGRAAKAGYWMPVMVFAGAVFAVSVKADLFSLTYLPVLLFTFLYMNHVRHRHSVGRGSAGFAAGFALVALFVFDGSGGSQGFGDFMQKAAGGPHDNFAEALSLSQWPVTYYLHILTGLWLLSAVLLFKAQSRGGYSGFAAVASDPATRPYGFCLSLCFVYGLIVMTLEGGMGWNVLGHSQWTVFLIPPACIGLAGILERCGFNDERYHRHSAALFLTTLTLISYPSLQAFLMQASIDQWTTLVFWVASLTLLLQMPAMQKIKTRRAAVMVLILLAGFFLTGPDNPVWNKGVHSEPQMTQLNEISYE
ncbi:MAG: hypothetical protein OEZ51_13900 [Nitrospinota bacterium]|nr:hypothetical protein [Nitrospinota bacterium]